MLPLPHHCKQQRRPSTYQVDQATRQLHGLWVHQRRWPGSTPHIFHIYAQPTTRGQPVESLPAWFEEHIIGPMPQYHALYEGARELDNWGIATDIARIRDFDTLEQEATAKIRKWETHLATYTTGRHAARSQLEGARASYQLTNFQNLGPVQECGQFTRRGRVSPTAHGCANVARG